jgi:hypothetical protein
MEQKISMFNEAITQKWAPVLNNEDGGKIRNAYIRNVTAQLLENQHNSSRVSAHQNGQLWETAPTNSMGGGAIGTWDPILISMVRRSAPNLIAYDICGVSAMTGPTGLVFAYRSRYGSQSGTEALFNEADPTFSANNVGQNLSGQGLTANSAGTDPFGSNYAASKGMTTAQAEALGDGTSGNNIAEMAFDITKITVTAVSRALKAEYSLELAQDYKAIHGGNVEDDLSSMLSSEILTEINREVIRKLYYIAKTGAQSNTATAGTFDLDVDANGRWSVEKFKGLLYQAEREANAIGRQTRRGRGNIIVASSDVASALAMAGKLDYAPALSTNLDVDDTGNTFVGVLNGRFKVYIDPYFISSGNDELLMVGYRGSNPMDAGFFYCPYVPLEMVRAVGEQTFNPKIAFKTRFGVVENAFYSNTDGSLVANANPYYRLIKVTNIL